MIKYGFKLIIKIAPTLVNNMDNMDNMIVKIMK